MTWEEGPGTPMAEEGQAQALRNRLNQELAAVQATDQARERLVRATATRTRAGHGPGWEPRRLRPAVAFPLAGALVAAVIAAAVAIPTFLQAETDAGPGVPAHGGGPVPGPSLLPATSVPTPTPTSTSDRVPTAGPEPAPETTPGDGTAPPAAEQPAAAPRSGLRLSANPASPAVGQRISLTIRGVPDRHGDVTVDWADRKTDTVIQGSCARDTVPRAADPVGHAYARAGKYVVKVTVDLCGDRTTAELTVDVGSVVPAEPDVRSVAPADPGS